MHFSGLPHRRAKHVAGCGRQIDITAPVASRLECIMVTQTFANSQPPSSFSPQDSTIQKKGRRGKENKDSQNFTLTFINNCPIAGGNASGSSSQSQTQLIYLYAMLLKD